MVDPVVVSYSELDTFRQCPLKHHLGYRQRWTRPVKPGSALDKGILWHQVMEVHYRTLQEHQQRHGGRIPIGAAEKQALEQAKQRALQFLFDPVTGEQTEVQELVQWMYEGYVEVYGVDRRWRVLGTEHQIVTPLRDRRGRRSRYHLKAKLDLLVFDYETAGIWVVDHKSGGNLPTKMDLEIDDQFGLYTWAMREMGRQVAGSLHNAARTTRNQADYPGYVGKSKPQTAEQRFSRTYLNRTDVELTNLALDAYEAARSAYPTGKQTPPRYSSPDPRQCGWKCDFKEAHLLMRQGRDPQEVLQEFGFKIDTRRH